MSCKEPTTAMIDGLSIESNKTEVYIDIKIDQELKFDEHIKYIHIVCLYMCVFVCVCVKLKLKH